MNPLKKLKLKSQLRNCDYLLAGNVIKQQYYDANKSTVINRLIDEFMADPGFENALKLIEYNEMMVFYFTESCAGGLYIRKQDPHKTGPFTPIADSPAAQSQNSSPMPTLDPLGVTKEQQAVTDWKQERQRRILEESQAWMDEMIASGSRKTESTDTSLTDTNDESYYSSSATEEHTEYDLEETLVMEPVRLSEDEAGHTTYNDTYSDQEYPMNGDIGASGEFDYPQDTVDSNDAPFTPDEEPLSSPATPTEFPDLASASTTSSETQPAFTHEQFDAAWGQSAAADDHQHNPYTEELIPAPAAAAVPPKPKKRSYDNVIATLQIDIHTMSQQLEEYRQELSFFPSNEKQLIAWIHSLETAIEEFSEVIEMLEDD